MVELNFLLAIWHNIYYCTGSIKLRIESELSSESVLDTKYNASIFITVTERLGITNFKDINLVLSAQEKTLMGSEISKLQVCIIMLGRVGYSNNIMIATVVV